MSRNQGIQIGGDGMGGRRGGGRQWGFGDDSDDEKLTYTTKGGGAPRSVSANIPSSAPKEPAPVSKPVEAPAPQAALPTRQREATSSKENNMDSEAHKEIYRQGLEIRKKVVGEDYVAKALANGGSDFLRPLQQYATEAAWGTIWTRPGLELKTRSLLNLVMLTALAKWTELGTHVRGAIRNGASEVEIREALLQAAAYCGVPAGLEAFNVADKVITEMKQKGEF